MPIVEDRVALRLSFFSDDEAGYFKRSYCTDPAAAMALTCTPLSTTGITTVKNVGALDTYGGAAALTFKVTDTLTITPRIMQQRADYNGFPLADYRSVPGNGYGYPVPSPGSPVPLPRPLLSEQLHASADVQCAGRRLRFLGACIRSASTGRPATASSSPRLPISPAKWMRLRMRATSSTRVLLRMLPAARRSRAVSRKSRTISVSSRKCALRPISRGPFNSSSAAIYSDFHGRLPTAAYYPGATAPGLDATLTGGTGEVTPGYPNLIFAQDFHTEIKEPAAFGEVSYQPIEPLKLTAGLRWYQVKTSASGYELGAATGGGPAIVSPPATATENGTNPKFEADYHLTPDDMIYASAAKGFRPGGLVPIVPPGVPNTGTDCVAALKQTNPNITIADTRSFQSDSLWSYELGTKTSWFDHRVTFDAAGFYIKWKNIQQEIFLSCGFQYVANAGAAVSKGGEMELRARPTEPLEFSLGVGYQNAKITESSAASPQQVGSPVYQVPDWTGNTAVSYTTQVTSDWKLLSGADYSYIGRSYSGTNDPSDPRLRGSYRLLNASFAFIRDRFQVALVGKNLANEVAVLGDNRSLAAEINGRPRLFINQPRTVGVEFRQSF